MAVPVLSAPEASFQVPLPVPSPLTSGVSRCPAFSLGLLCTLKKALVVQPLGQQDISSPGAGAGAYLPVLLLRMSERDPELMVTE